MRVAILISNLRFGGAEIQSVELANRLAARGMRVLLISMEDIREVSHRITPQVEVLFLKKRHYIDFSLLKNIIAAVESFKPRHLLTVNSYPALYGFAAGIFTGWRFTMINIQHTTLFEGWADAVQNTYYPPILNRMDRIVFVSKNQRQYWEKKFRIKPEKSTVIHNGIDLEKYFSYTADTYTVRAALGILPGDIVLGLNANFRPEKRHEDLVDAAEILINNGYPVKLLFLGDGVRRRYIEGYIRSKQLDKYVAITGFVQDVRPYLAAVDIAVLTSTAVETLSVAIIESMALGKAAVLSDIGGANELVESGENGFLYEAGNVEQLVEALKKVIDRRLFEVMGQKSKEKVSRLFDAKKMEELYIGLLSGLQPQRGWDGDES